MGFEIQDIKKIKCLKDENRASWRRAAILGDCKFYFTWKDIDPNKEGEFNLTSFKEYFNLEEVQTFDLFGSPTVVQDLHEKIDGKFEGYFDIVFDAGTLFCCFDVARVWKNIFYLVKDDGFIWHLSGLVGYFGRSYYSFHPMLFRDFYSANNFKILNMSVRSKASSKSYLEKFLPFYRSSHYQDWVNIDKNSVYYGGVTKKGNLVFSSHNTPRSDLILNDSVISCFVQCAEKKQFKMAIPPFYQN